MSDFNIVVPEVAAGRAVAQSLYVEFTIQNETTPINVDDLVFLSVSKLKGTVIKEITNVAGVTPRINVILDHLSPEILVQGEDITVNGITVAQVSITAVIEKYYLQKTVLAGGNNSFNLTTVDRFGGLRVAYHSGTPQLDSTGRTQIAERTILGTYNNIFDDPTDFLNTIIAGGSNAIEINSESMLMTTANGATDSIKRVSNLYHSYVIGTSMLIVMKMAVGDTGKTNVVREWGYYDDNDGIIFQLTDTTFNIVLRSSVSGAPVDTVIAQNKFNRDVVDGSDSSKNDSRVLLDPSKINAYWIDINESITIRCGIIVNGFRLILHVFEHGNNNQTNIFKTHSLPLTMQQKNNGVVGSSSELRFFSGSVILESLFNPRGKGNSLNTINSVNVTNTGWTPLISFRPKVNNHSYIIVRQVSTYAAVAGVKAPVKFAIFLDSVLTGAVFNLTGDIAEVDLSATALIGGDKSIERFGDGISSFDFRPSAKNTKKFLYNKADGSQRILTIAAQSFDVTPVDVYASVNWEEIQI